MPRGLFQEVFADDARTTDWHASLQCDTSPHRALNVKSWLLHGIEVKHHRQTSFSSFLALRGSGTRVAVPTSFTKPKVGGYCCHPDEDAEQNCKGGYVVDRECMAQQLFYSPDTFGPGVLTAQKRFADGGKHEADEYCCKPEHDMDSDGGCHFDGNGDEDSEQAGSIWLGRYEVQPEPKGGAKKLTSYDVVENSMSCNFKQISKIQGCRVIHNNNLNPVGENYEKCAKHKKSDDEKEDDDIAGYEKADGDEPEKEDDEKEIAMQKYKPMQKNDYVD